MDTSRALSDRWDPLVIDAELGDAERRLAADASAALDRQIALVRIAAPTGAEAARAAHVGAALARNGLRVVQDAVGNVIAQPPRVGLARGEAPVVVMAHLDTVFEAGTPLHLHRAGTTVHCPGIGDNGRGLCALLSLAGELAQPAWHAVVRRNVIFVATVGEEGRGNLRGARHYFDARDAAGLPVPHAVLVLDGPGDATIVHHAVASTRVRVIWRGAGGHSWVDRLRPNAVHAAGAAIAALARLSRDVPPGASLAVTRMGGGEAVNSIPETAWVEVDIRAQRDTDIASLRRAVTRIAQQATDDASRRMPQYALSCTAETLGNRPGGSLAADHPLVRLAERVTVHSGVTPVSAMASTDANIPLSRGIPAIALGGGGTGGGAHTLDEWYDDTHGTRGLVRALGVLVGMTAD